MGNAQSNILERLDDIASEYILEADYNTMKKMKDKDYCNKVTIVTKDILEKQFSHLDIEYLATRANTGWSWDTLFRTTTQNPEDNTITYPKKDSVGFIRKIENPNKPEMCLSISKFYVKIGHLFSAIVSTIKPRYNFSNGQSYSIMTPKNELPKNPEGAGDGEGEGGAFTLSENGFCYKRIETLRFGNNTTSNPSAINPQFCSANSGYSSANDIPGVPEFEMLYYDTTDERGNPMMSDRNLAVYRKDLATFYKRFTDETQLPNDIHKFSEIQLKQYSTSERCMDNKYNKAIEPNGNSRETPLFEDYAMNLREMIQVTGDLQHNLVEILNKIFTKKKDGEKHKITIQPNLTVERLDRLVVDTRNKLLELYLRCEEYFENGVKIYKAIVNERIITNTFDEFVAEDEYPSHPYVAPVPVPVPTPTTIQTPIQTPTSQPPYVVEDVYEDVYADEDADDDEEFVPGEDETMQPIEAEAYLENPYIENIPEKPFQASVNLEQPIPAPFPTPIPIIQQPVTEVSPYQPVPQPQPTLNQYTSPNQPPYILQQPVIEQPPQPPMPQQNQPPYILQQPVIEQPIQPPQPPMPQQNQPPYILQQPVIEQPQQPPMPIQQEGALEEPKQANPPAPIIAQPQPQPQPPVANIQMPLQNPPPPQPPV